MNTVLRIEGCFCAALRPSRRGELESHHSPDQPMAQSTFQFKKGCSQGAQIQTLRGVSKGPPTLLMPIVAMTTTAKKKKSLADLFNDKNMHSA